MRLFNVIQLRNMGNASGKEFTNDRSASLSSTAGAVRSRISDRVQMILQGSMKYGFNKEGYLFFHIK